MGQINGNGAFPASGGAANADGSRMFFLIAEPLSPADTDSQTDVYERGRSSATAVAVSQRKTATNTATTANERP